jgi:hypothetical protein
VGGPQLRAGDPQHEGRAHHSGDEVLTRHVQNSRKRKLTVKDDHEREMHTLAKPAHHSPLKIDGAMAAVLAWEARGDAIAAGVISTRRSTGCPRILRPQRWQPGTALPAMALTVPAESGPFGELS